MKVKRLWTQFREIAAIVVGGLTVLTVVSVAFASDCVSKTIILITKAANLPLVLLASVIYPEETPLLRRIKRDVVQWWKTLA